MGAYSLDELLPNSLRETILRTVVEPTLHGLAADGIRYQGFLYIGLMITSEGPKVLEFNCRLGDPETQAIMARLDCDLAEILHDLSVRRFDPAKFRWRSGASVCIVLASEGYPGKYSTGKPISGLTNLTANTGVKVLHAGTKLIGDVIATSGGRVLGVTSAAPTLDEAVANAYAAVNSIKFDGMQFRRDIGAQAGLAHSAGN
jgi:phosphoribosylamine--glycine ligase